MRLVPWLILALLFSSCGHKKQDQKSEVLQEISTSSEKNQNMFSEKDFNELLEKTGLPPVYVYDSVLQQQQLKYTNTVTISDAFAQGLESLFVHAASCVGCDDFYTMVTTQPESFQLSDKATPEEIKKAILNEISKDNSFKICLLPEDTENNSPEGISLFPPENGESIKDYWIWYIKCSFFPGPAWMLVKRDGSAKAFHYGYM